MLTIGIIVGRLLPCLLTMSDNNSHVAMALLELIQNIIKWQRFWNPVNICNNLDINV